PVANPPVTAVTPVTPPAPPVQPPAPAPVQPLPAVVTTLPQAPIDGLYEQTPKGKLPVIRKSDGMTAFKAYRRPFDRAAAKGPIVSIAVMDLGVSASASQSALADMPPEI